MPEIEALIKSCIPSSNLLQEVSSELIFQLPLSEVDNFQKLFAKIDENLFKLQIENYGVSITTLEEVFIKTSKRKEIIDGIE